MSKISQNVVDLSKAISPAIKIEVADGMATTTVEKDLYLKNLPEGLTKETIEKVQDYNSVYFAATAKAFGEAAIPVLKENKKIDSISADFPMIGKDNWAVNIDRSKEYPNPKGGEPTTTFGAMSFKLETQAARGSRGVIKHIREEMAVAALAALGGK